MVYVVPEIRSFLSEHPLERSTTGIGELVPLADITVAVVVVVAVVVIAEHVPSTAFCATLTLSASLARLAINPVAVARPTTAAARNPTRIERMSTVFLRGASPSPPIVERVEKP